MQEGRCNLFDFTRFESVQNLQLKKIVRSDPLMVGDPKSPELVIKFSARNL